MIQCTSVVCTHVYVSEQGYSQHLTPPKLVCSKHKLSVSWKTQPIVWWLLFNSFCLMNQHTQSRTYARTHTFIAQLSVMSLSRARETDTFFLGHPAKLIVIRTDKESSFPTQCIINLWNSPECPSPAPVTLLSLLPFSPLPFQSVLFFLSLSLSAANSSNLLWVFVTFYLKRIKDLCIYSFI